MANSTPDRKPGISLRLKLGALVALVATIPVVIVGMLAIQANAEVQQAYLGT